jgi:hypothetical protein
MSDRYVMASELKSFAFCRRAWFLERQGTVSALVSERARGRAEGPDGIPRTFDDQRLTVYAQNSVTLGQDRYLLTNPASLRMLNAGLLAEAGTEWRRLTLHASFVAEKSDGPTNPVDAVYENDPGVIGALLLDPNTAIHATGRSFVDRAYVGKIQASYRLPSACGGIEVASVADYMDGLVFARQENVRDPEGERETPYWVIDTG